MEGAISPPKGTTVPCSLIATPGRTAVAQPPARGIPASSVGSVPTASVQKQHCCVSAERGPAPLLAGGAAQRGPLSPSPGGGWRGAGRRGWGVWLRAGAEGDVRVLRKPVSTRLATAGVGGPTGKGTKKQRKGKAEHLSKDCGTPGGQLLPGEEAEGPDGPAEHPRQTGSRLGLHRHRGAGIRKGRSLLENQHLGSDLMGLMVHKLGPQAQPGELQGRCRMEQEEAGALRAESAGGKRLSSGEPESAGDHSTTCIWKGSTENTQQALRHWLH